MAIIDTLSDHHWNEPDNFAFIKINHTATDRARIRNFLFKECITRYQKLSEQSYQNFLIMKQHLNVTHTPMDKSHLIVLDVDETILDQRAMRRAQITVPYRDLKASFTYRMNGQDLVFGVRSIQDNTGKENPHFIVYRPFVMKYIHENMDKTNFVIYSLGDPAYVLYHVVLIEMYFNYVLRLTSDEYRRAPVFEFDYVIGRIPDRSSGRNLQHKSLLILDALIGDLSKFDSIQIVDDMGHDVWYNDFPPRLVQNGTSSTKIFPFEAAIFEMEIQSANMELERTYLRRQRSCDTYFQDLVTLQQLLADYDPESEMRNETLIWMLPFEVQFMIDNLRKREKRQKARSQIQKMVSRKSNASSDEAYCAFGDFIKSSDSDGDEVC